MKPAPNEPTLARLRTFYDVSACLLDEMQLEAWAELFAATARYRVISRENFDQGLPHATLYCRGIGMLRDRILSIRKALVFEERHLRRMISSVRINVLQGAALNAQASFLVIESFSDARPEIVMVGRYIDELIDTGENFLIGNRDCVFDNYWTPRSIVVPI